MESILLAKVSPIPSIACSSKTEHSPISIIEPNCFISSFAFYTDIPLMLVNKSNLKSSVVNLLNTCGAIVSLVFGFILHTAVIIDAASSSVFTQKGFMSVSNTILPYAPRNLLFNITLLAATGNLLLECSIIFSMASSSEP